MRISDWSSDACSSDLEAEGGQHVEGDVLHLGAGEAERLGAELVAKGPLVEGELHVEGAGEAGLQRLQRGLGEALGLEAIMVHAGRVLESAVADRVADDRLDLALAVAEGAPRLRHRAVDDLDIDAGGQHLELSTDDVGLARTKDGA